ncbi:hypothetical protein GCK32_008171 [Trichostrongylus colubriformis]|uniref:RING-type domain-containing protein n=1 Tax=Trichostrongylus colubriformis TaxID=6319 RepID=A0AAN8IVW4_TRICO
MLFRRSCLTLQCWMSTSRAGTHRSELQDVTECPICCLRYERPLQLSCGHSFCAKCVDRLNRLDQDMWWGRPMMPPPPPGLGGLPPYPRYLLRNHNDEPPFFPRRLLGGNAPGDNIIRCPECRQPTRVPPEGLPVNYRLQEILSHVAEVNEQSNDQCIMDGTPLRKCLACDDVLSKGLYLLCRTCPGETVRQLCSLCCLRNHNGHDIEEKRFLTMQDVTVGCD